jgi:hypothetical protein
MKTKNILFTNKFVLPILFVCFFNSLSLAQLINDGPKNIYVQSNDFSWDPFTTPRSSAGSAGVRIQASINGAEQANKGFVESLPGFLLLTPGGDTPYNWTKRRSLINVDDETNSEFGIFVLAWENNPLIFTSSPYVYDFHEQCFPVVGCLPVVPIDLFVHFKETVLPTIIGEPVELTTTSNIELVRTSGAPTNTEINLRTIWRYSNGDNFASALDFGTLNSNLKSHINSNREAPSGIPSSKGYTNHIGGPISDVIYKFKVPSGNPRAITITTDYPETDYDSLLRLYDSNETSIAFDDDGGTGLTSKIDRVLAPGTYYVVVEGVGSIPRGKFKVSVDANAIYLTPGSINIPSELGFCYGADLPGITNNTPGSLGMASDVPVTYKWFIKVGSGSFLVIPGATGQNLTAAQSRGIGSVDRQFYRVARVGSIQSLPSNTITFTSQVNFGVVNIDSNNGPLCSGSDAVYMLASENGSSDAGALVSYTLDGVAGSGSLDSNGELTITSTGITTASTLDLIDISLNGCSLSLTASETVEIIPAPTSIACGQTINGNNSNGSDVILNYDGGDEWSGKEDIYEFTVLSNNMPVEIDLTGMDSNDDLDLILIDVCEPSIVHSASTEYYTDEHISVTLPAGNYYLVVDGYRDTDESAYTLTLESCGVQAACDAIIDLECFETISDDNTGNSLFYNSCSTTYLSKLYKITPEVSGTMTLDLTGLSADLDLLLYDDICNTSCAHLAISQLGGSASEQIVYNSIVGGTTYYILVREFNGAESTFNLEVDCPAGCACTTSVDYVEAVSNGEVCIGSTGSYLIQPVTGGNTSPGATVTYSLNGGSNQTVVLDGAGMATISDTPSSVGNPASTIALSKIEFSTCNIVLDTDAEFAANGFPTSFSVVSNNGLACVGGTGIYTITGSPGVTDPTPYAEVRYTLSVDGLPTVMDTIKLDAAGLGVVEVPNLPLGGSPGSSISLTSAVINGCTIGLSNGNSIVAWDYAQPVTIVPAPKDICPGDDAVFALSGRADDWVIFDTTNNGSLPATPDSIQLDGTGNATITITSPSNDVRIDVYTVMFSPFDNSFYAPCRVEYAYGDNFAEVEIAQIGTLAVTPEAANICFGENAVFDITVPGGSLASPNGTLNYTLNGSLGSITLDGNGEGQIADIDPGVGSSTVVLNSVSVDLDVGDCMTTFSGVTATVTIQAQPHPVTIMGNGPICTDATAIYEIGPATAGMTNPNAIVSFIVNGITEDNVTLNSSGIAMYTPSGPTTDSSIDLISLESSDLVCNTAIDDGTNINVFDVPNLVEVVANSPTACGDSLVSYTIQPVSGGAISKGATVHYEVDGSIVSTVLDTFGIAVVNSVSEFIGSAASTITLTSIENPGCSVALSSTASTDIIDCGDPCYQYMVRNFGVEAANDYQVEGFIEASACIGTASNAIDVTYSAGTFIDLQPGFEVSVGSTLECDINPCPVTETCGLVLQQSPTGTGNVPNELLRWDVVEENDCITELAFDISNPTPDVEIDMQGFVSGSSGPFNADLTVVSASGIGPTTVSIVVPPGNSVHSAGIYVSLTNRAYFVNITFDYDGTALAQAFIELQPL